MVRRFDYILLFAIIALCFVYFLDRKCQYSPTVIKFNIQEENIAYSAKDTSAFEDILHITRSKIREDLKDYNLTYSGVYKLEDLVMETGGTPLRSLVVSAWRSGSTFFAELLNAMPGNFYHYEPLLKYGIRQIRGPPHSEQATRLMKNMFHCNFSGMDDYFRYGKDHLEYLNQFEHNRRLWERCKDRIELCFDADFTGKLCRLFPFQSMKVVRFRLRLVESFLKDESLNVKVILLVRDPRGVLQSRSYRHYCRPSPDCIEPRLVCQDMISDYIAAATLMKKYPGRIMALRFEDLSLNLNETVAQIQKFLNQGPTDAVNEFIRTHTNMESGGMDSTFKVTRTVPFKWRKLLSFGYVESIQEFCKTAMRLWGYNPAVNASHMVSDTFSPLTSYNIKIKNIYN